MKFLISHFFLLISSICFAQTNTYQEKTWTLTRVYGVVKYYNNEKDDSYLDDELIKILPKLTDANYSTDQLNEDMPRLFPANHRELNPNIKSQSPFDQFEGTDHKRTIDFSWIDTDQIITEANKKLLWQLISTHKSIANSNIKKRHVFVHHEAGVPETITGPNLYLLGLIKCWNVMEYCFPYKPLMDEPWDKVFYNAIPGFQSIKTEKDYFTALQKLTAKLDDSHINVEDKQVTYSAEVSKFPFSIEIAENQLVIKSINDSLSNLYQLRTGDVMEKLNGKNYQELWDDYSELFAYSTQQAGIDDFKLYFWHYCNNNDTTIQATIRSDGKIHNEKIKTIELKTYLALRPDTKNESRFWSIDSDIGYIRYKGLGYADLGKAIHKLKHKDYLILDLRGHNYGLSSFRLVNFMGNKKIPVSKFYKPNHHYPGIYYNPRIIRFRIWPKLNSTYKGKVIVLMNEGNMCAMESLIMAIDARRPDAVLIGSPTQGCNGSQHFIELPGDQKVWFTGHGDLQYPDGSQLQRIGIKPDIFVQPSIESIGQDEDVVLNRALEYIADCFKKEN